MDDRIVALYGRGREIGFVIFYRDQMMRYGVKTIPGKRRGRGFEKRIEKAVTDVLSLAGWGGVIVAERNRPTVHQGALRRILPQVLKRVERPGLKTHYLSLDAVKVSLCGNNKAMHQQLVASVGRLYPILVRLIEGGTTEKRKYWQKVFIAVALALVGKGQLEERFKRNRSFWSHRSKKR